MSCCLHSSGECSRPVQLISPINMFVLPRPKKPELGIFWALPHWRYVHTTAASFISQVSSHTLPHWPFWYNSTLPVHLLDPLTNLTLPKTKYKLYKNSNVISVPFRHPDFPKSSYLNKLLLPQQHDSGWSGHILSGSTGLSRFLCRYKWWCTLSPGRHVRN